MVASTVYVVFYPKLKFEVKFGMNISVVHIFYHLMEMNNPNCILISFNHLRRNASRTIIPFSTWYMSLNQ